MMHYVYPLTDTQWRTVRWHIANPDDPHPWALLLSAGQVHADAPPTGTPALRLPLSNLVLTKINKHPVRVQMSRKNMTRALLQSQRGGLLGAVIGGVASLIPTIVTGFSNLADRRDFLTGAPNKELQAEMDFLEQPHVKEWVGQTTRRRNAEWAALSKEKAEQQQAMVLTALQRGKSGAGWSRALCLK